MSLSLLNLEIKCSEPMTTDTTAKEIKRLVLAFYTKTVDVVVYLFFQQHIQKITKAMYKIKYSIVAGTATREAL